MPRRSPTRVPAAGPRLPQATLHKPSGRARVFLPIGPGRRAQIWLGEWGTPAAQAEYQRVVRLWLEAGRTWPPPAPQLGACRTVVELSDRYAAWARSYYTRGARQTATAVVIERALELLYRAGLGGLQLEHFGPRALERFQHWLVGHPERLWSRSTINTYVGHVRAMFRWAVAQELVPETQYRALQALQPLRKGRAPAPGMAAPRENEEVPPVPLEHVRLVLPFMPPTVARMVQLHALAGMRIGELLAMRLGHLHHEDGRPLWSSELAADAPQVLVYRVPADANKTEHHGRARRVYIGPAGCSVLWAELHAAQQLEQLHASTVVFSPRRAEQQRLAELRRRALEAGRPVRKRVAAQVREQVGETYNRHSYRNAVRRACHAYNAAQQDAAARIPTWCPLQLRHTAASRFAAAESLEAAKELLGHAELRTTMRYVEVDSTRLADAARRLG